MPNKKDVEIRPNRDGKQQNGYQPNKLETPQTPPSSPPSIKPKDRWR